jgi:divalent metal cation (Fe/Co/Zn/Cd) transporter
VTRREQALGCAAVLFAFLIVVGLLFGSVVLFAAGQHP